MAGLVFIDRKQFFDASGYNFLPFRFRRLNGDSVLLTNDVGEFACLSSETFKQFIDRQLTSNRREYLDLKSKFFLSDGSSASQTRILASRYRTKKSFLDGFTKLHLFVVTLRCDHSCPYCQVSRQCEDKMKYDMSRQTAFKAADVMLKGPAPTITCEFQGGEPLLNFPLIEELILYIKAKNERIGKRIDFVVCTNLAPLTDKHLDFFKAHDVKVSTSLDGPAIVHDVNRPWAKGSSHQIVVRNLQRVQEALGMDAISALMTTTKTSLSYPDEIVDEYLRLGLRSIVLRSLSPFGFAVKTMNAIGYSADEFVHFYKRVFDRILDVNRGGTTFSEGMANLILSKILTPFPTSYVDLQSPAGAGFGAVAYSYDGDVYASDESRMLAEANDKTFRLGNVMQDSYETIFYGERMQQIASAACNEALPGCSDCVFQPYCGADPVYNYATQGDMVGNRPMSGFCNKTMPIMSYLFELLLRKDDELERIFLAWINQASIAEMSLPA